MGLVRDLGSVGKKDLPICFSQGYKHISIFLESFTRGSGRRHCLVRPKQQNRKLSKSDVEQKDLGGYRSSFFSGKVVQVQNYFVNSPHGKVERKYSWNLVQFPTPTAAPNNPCLPGLFQNNTAVQPCVQVILMEAIEKAS